MFPKCEDICDTNMKPSECLWSG